MPVHLVEGGYRWGKHGHVYPTRAGAERQARAIYASGWREDASRKALARALRASPRAEANYVMAISNVFRNVHGAVLKLVKSEGYDTGLRLDAAGDPPDVRHVGLGARLLALIVAWAKPRIELAFDAAANDVVFKVQEGLTLVGIDPRNTVAGIDGYIAVARRENVELIRNATEDFLTEVRGVLETNEGATPRFVAAELQKVVNVSKARARLIATDQILKLSAKIAEHRMRSAGINSYTWDTSQDERVRPMHRVLQGQTFNWNDPPVTNPEGDTNHPGGDYRCRCVAIPVV